VRLLAPYVKDRALARVIFLAVAFVFAGRLAVGRLGGAPTDKRVEAPHAPPVDRHAIDLEGGGPRRDQGAVKTGGWSGAAS
jgi:hypothetical protein